MKPYYQDNCKTIHCGDCRQVLPELDSSSIDLLVTDPPYGIGFMGKDWDKALPDKQIWQECFRVLKDGAFAFVMSIPRADCLSRMIISLEDAGFWVNFTPIFWAYASGFPKAENISLAIDKRECLRQLAEKLGRKPTKVEFDEAWKAFRETIGHYLAPDGIWRDCEDHKPNEEIRNPDTHYGYKTSGFRPIDAPTTPQAKALDGSYGGFQPKPAVEVIIVAMKPLSEKTFVDQALKNRHGISWLDGGRIPFQDDGDRGLLEYKASKDFVGVKPFGGIEGKGSALEPNNQGRFPANLLVSDDVLNIASKGAFAPVKSGQKSWGGRIYGKFASGGDDGKSFYGDSGSFSRYFDLDKWFEDRIQKLPESVQKTFPFLIVPKASKGEKDKYLDSINKRICRWNNAGKWQDLETTYKNIHPTVKPLKLISYLITLGSREGDVVLDNFMGSGTTPLACQLLGRKCIGIDNQEQYCEITVQRCRQYVLELV